MLRCKASADPWPDHLPMPTFGSRPGRPPHRLQVGAAGAIRASGAGKKPFSGMVLQYRDSIERANLVKSQLNRQVPGPGLSAGSISLTLAGQNRGGFHATQNDCFRRCPGRFDRACKCRRSLRQSAQPPVYVSTWTGCYVGGHVGYGREESTSSINGYQPMYGDDFYPSTIDQGFNNNGVAGGGQGGCQLQTGNFLWGIEGDWTSFNNSASKSVTNSSPMRMYYTSTNTYNETLSKSSLWSVRARFGIITSEVFHLYGTVGIGGEKASATVSMTYNTTYLGGTYCSTDPSYYCGSGAVSVSKNSTGIVAGVGAEWKVWSNVIVGAEWLHYALANDVAIPGSNNCYYCNGYYGATTFAQGSSVHFGDADVVRFRASYLFNFGR